MRRLSFLVPILTLSPSDGVALFGVGQLEQSLLIGGICWANGYGSVGMPCTQCARSAKFWMSANTRTLVLAPFHKFLVPYQGFFGFPSI